MPIEIVTAVLNDASIWPANSHRWFGGCIVAAFGVTWIIWGYACDRCIDLAISEVHQRCWIALLPIAFSILFLLIGTVALDYSNALRSVEMVDVAPYRRNRYVGGMFAIAVVSWITAVAVVVLTIKNYRIVRKQVLYLKMRGFLGHKTGDSGTGLPSEN